MPEPIITVRATPEVMRQVDQFASRYELSRSSAALLLLSFGLRNQAAMMRDVAQHYAAAPTGGDHAV